MERKYPHCQKVEYVSTSLVIPTKDNLIHVVANMMYACVYTKPISWRLGKRKLHNSVYILNQPRCFSEQGKRPGI